MQLEDWLRLLTEAHALGCRNVQFIGGEPLLYAGLPQLVREAKRLNYDLIEVFTNGTRFTDDIVTLFKATGAMLATSFYAKDRCTHDAITGVRGSQQKTVEAVRRAIANRIPTRVGVIAMKAEDAQIQSTVDFLRALGVEDIGVDRVRRFGRGAQACESRDPMDELCGACWRGSLAVNSAGDVSPCIFSHFYNVGHVSAGLSTILEEKPLLDFRKTMRDRRIPSSKNYPGLCQPYGCNPNDCSPQTGCEPYCSPRYYCNPKY
jgi:MoaA/NifB/PqqE/SkfB family radical SAM enzyme